LAIIKAVSKNGLDTYVIGAYTDIPWSISEGYK
jgi:hypothetical protein